VRKVLAILLLIGLGVGFYFYLSTLNDAKEIVKGINESKQPDLLEQIKDDYEGMIKQVRILQQNVDQISTFNSKLTQLLYSGNLSEDDVKLLMKLQREYFSKDLLDKNPEGIMLTRLIEEINKYETLGINMIGYDMLGPEFIGNDKKMAIVKVKYYMNITSEEGEVYKGYVYEENEEELWELKGFDEIEEFPIID